MCICKKDNKVIVSDFKIVRLQYEAQGFRNSFFVMCNSFLGKENCEKWNQNGDAMSVIGTVGCFSIELYLKFLMVIITFSNETYSGYHTRKHSLNSLYKDIEKIDSKVIKDLEVEYSNSKYRGKYESLKKFLTSIKDYFIEWRYSYDYKKLNVNLNLLCDVLNFLEQFTQNLYLKVSYSFLKLNPKANPLEEQTMTISSFDDIKRVD